MLQHLLPAGAPRIQVATKNNGSLVLGDQRRQCGELVLVITHPESEVDGM